MALTAAQIQSRIDALEKARDSGVSMVRHGGTITQWRTVAELDNILAGLYARLDNTNGTTKPRVNYVQQNSKGL